MQCNVLKVLVSLKYDTAYGLIQAIIFIRFSRFCFLLFWNILLLLKFQNYKKKKTSQKRKILIYVTIYKVKLNRWTCQVDNSIKIAILFEAIYYSSRFTSDMIIECKLDKQKKFFFFIFDFVYSYCVCKCTREITSQHGSNNIILKVFKMIERKWK